MSESNRLLAALAPDDYTRLLRTLEPVPLQPNQVLAEPEEPVEHVYFPRSGLVSIVRLLEDGSVIEVASVGTEGLVGLPLLLGASIPQTLASCQLAGTAVRLAAPALRDAVQQSPAFQSLVLRYTHARLDEVTLTSACIGHHGTAARLARRLLTTRDRAMTDRFPVTHEFLGNMLGVRRTTVSLTANTLQEAGLIRYARGQMTILDRLGLEAVACECYWRIRETYERAYH